MAAADGAACEPLHGPIGLQKVVAVPTHPASTISACPDHAHLSALALPNLRSVEPEGRAATEIGRDSPTHQVATSAARSAHRGGARPGLPVRLADPNDGNLWYQSFHQNDLINEPSKPQPNATHSAMFDACRNDPSDRCVSLTIFRHVTA